MKKAWGKKRRRLSGMIDELLIQSVNKVFDKSYSQKLSEQAVNVWQSTSHGWVIGRQGSGQNGAATIYKSHYFQR